MGHLFRVCSDFVKKGLLSSLVEQLMAGRVWAGEVRRIDALSSQCLSLESLESTAPLSFLPLPVCIFKNEVYKKITICNPKTLNLS